MIGGFVSSSCGCADILSVENLSFQDDELVAVMTIQAIQELLALIVSWERRTSK